MGTINKHLVIDLKFCLGSKILRSGTGEILDASMLSPDELHNGVAMGNLELAVIGSPKKKKPKLSKAEKKEITGETWASAREG